MIATDHDRPPRFPSQHARRRAPGDRPAAARRASSSARTSRCKLALACLLARGHLLIEDIPGVGKSTLAQALAATLGLKYSRIQFTSDLLPADVLGVSIYDERAQSFRFHAGPDLQFGRARRRNQPRAAQDAKRAARGDGGAAGVAWTARRASCPTRFSSSPRRIPVEQIGAYPLPESQLDRFLMAIELGYPDPAAERELLAGGDRRAGSPTRRRPPMRRRWPTGSARRRKSTSRPRCSTTCRRCSRRRAATPANGTSGDDRRRAAA